MNRIRDIRTKQGLSQNDLAKILHTSRQAISLYERGDREPKLQTWKDLASALNVSVGYLQGIDDSVPYPNSIDDLNKFQKENPTKSVIEFLKIQNLKYLDSIEVAGWEYEKNLNDHQIDLLLTTISSTYNAWLAYDNESNYKDPNIDHFFEAYSKLISEMSLVAMLMYSTPDQKEYDINFSDLIKKITPVTEQFQALHKKIDQRDSMQ